MREATALNFNYFDLFTMLLLSLTNNSNVGTENKYNASSRLDFNFSMIWIKTFLLR